MIFNQLADYVPYHILTKWLCLQLKFHCVRFLVNFDFLYGSIETVVGILSSSVCSVKMLVPDIVMKHFILANKQIALSLQSSELWVVYWDFTVIKKFTLQRATLKFFALAYCSKRKILEFFLQTQRVVLKWHKDKLWNMEFVGSWVTKISCHEPFWSFDYVKNSHILR